MLCIVYRGPTQISLKTVVMRGPAGCGGVPITGPDLARYTDPNDGGLRHHHLLLQTFLRQGCGWTAAVKGVLGG